jgi:hypothetical protein
VPGNSALKCSSCFSSHVRDTHPRSDPSLN